MYSQQSNGFNPMGMSNYSALSSSNKDGYQSKYYGSGNKQQNGYSKYYQQGFGQQSGGRRRDSHIDELNKCQSEKNQLVSYVNKLAGDHSTEISNLSGVNYKLKNDSNKYFNYNFLFVVIILILAFVVYYLYTKDNYINLNAILSN